MFKKIILIAGFVVVLSSFATAKPFERVREYTISFDSTEVFNVVDEMPEIIGGIQEIYKHIEYPRSARLAEIEGRVFLKFIVDEKGNVSNPMVIKDIGGGCGDAAIAGIKKVKFKPGKNGGEPVRVYYTLPVTFKIQN